MKKVILIGLIGLSSVVFGDDFSNKKSMLVEEVKTMKKLYTELDNCLTPTKNETQKRCVKRAGSRGETRHLCFMQRTGLKGLDKVFSVDFA